MKRVTGTLHEDLRTFMIISRWFLLRMWNVSGRSYRENQNEQFIFNEFSGKSCHLLDNVENMVELNRPHMTT